MLEHVPGWLGKAMARLRAGTDQLATARLPLGAGTVSIDLSSPAFADGARLPPRFTADGEGVSPPLVWGTPPAGTAALALLVEDADAPAPKPLVHAIVTRLPADAGRLAEGAIVADGEGNPVGDVGRASFGREGWLPPDPPTGHGPHRYVFQLFALDAAAPDPGDTPGRRALIEAIEGHVLGVGLLTGTYSRGQEAPVGRAGAAQPV